MVSLTALIPLALASLSLAAPSSMVKRGDFDKYGDYTGSTSSYADGQGTYVRSDDDHRYASGVHCWTDLFYVDRFFESQNWQRDDTSIDCATTENCQSAVVQSSERCATWNLSVEVSADFSIIKDILSVGGGITTEEGGSECVTASSENRCQWNDQMCHAIWTSDVVLVSRGYVRRRCDSKDGDYTAWSKDTEVRTPQNNTRIGCAAKCDDQNYPGAIPLPPTA
ncbi:hypothetical protein EDC01DRAFT_648120 [Geopyxis carbonaria]|nr:hypothetical protein EDC01DRAFT_648120 [Geopyxis carbonaria]